MKHLVFVILLLVVFYVLGQNCKINDDEFLVTFHPHLDAFWLNTNKQLRDINFRPANFLYVMNQRNSKILLNSMLQALIKSKQRKYFITQTLFFKDWYNYISNKNKLQVIQLLESGQLEIANGGWVQNDEAICYYDDILNQYTVGMNYLYEEFGYHIKIGWATDSFGHSHSQAALLHLLGISFQGIQRVDDRYIHQHKERPLLQFFWQPISDSNNMSYGGVLNHVRHFLHEVNNLRNIGDGVLANDFKESIKVMKKYYRSNKYFRFLGNDFQEFKNEEFQNLEKVIDQLNKNQNKGTCMTFKYGNPTDYFRKISKYYEKSGLDIRKYDFIPNWDQERYWSGYYTSNPLIKKICKDLSRLVNFYKKSLFSTNTYANYTKTINAAEEMLALMQHHDGITATSKNYVIEGLKSQISQIANNVLKSITQIYNNSNTIMCKFYQQHNQCQIPQKHKYDILKTLQIITHGAPKQQKLQLILPNNTFYDILEVDQDIFCEITGQCTLVFETMLYPGINTFTMNKKNRNQMINQIFNIKEINGLSYKGGKDFTVFINQTDNNIKYVFGDGQYFSIGIYSLINKYYNKKAFWWNKYGQKIYKTEKIVPGLYIMANNGKLPNSGIQFTQLKIAQGKLYKRIYGSTKTSKLKLTIKSEMPNIIDIIHNFHPTNLSIADYFMRVSSSIKSDILYHDANGFLVVKRQLNTRPDYEVTINNNDGINANIYPVCSFAYFVEGDKKMVVFTDRAQGIASYQKDLIINFDRLTLDDGKGVAQHYIKTVNNIFRYKFGVVSIHDDIQRLWQNNYDQALIGYIQHNQQSRNRQRVQKRQVYSGIGNKINTYLKYSIFYLNHDQFVIRLQNLAEFSNITLKKYSNNVWDIEQLGVKFNFVDIKESYANGIPLQNQQKRRKYWGKNIQHSITAFNFDRLNDTTINLRPLQIRSFRLNKKQKIKIKQMLKSGQNNQLFQPLKNITSNNKLRKRCF